MATAYITEFADWPTQDVLTIPKWSSRVVEQTPVTVSGTSAQSAAFGASRTQVALPAEREPSERSYGRSARLATSGFRAGAQHDS